MPASGVEAMARPEVKHAAKLRANATGASSSSRTEASVAMKPAPPPNPLTYPQALTPFSYELFKKPTAEYHGCPLWAWNTELDKDALIRQIGYLELMGFGGFHMHVRTGLDTKYMGKEFMHIVKTCVDVAEQKGMMACLYVE